MKINNLFKTTLVVAVAGLFSIATVSCSKEKPYCGQGYEAVWAYNQSCGCYDWVCMPPINNSPNPCNSCGNNGNGNGNGNGGGGTYDNYHGSVYETALLTSIATQKAFAFEQGTGAIVVDNSGNAVTSPQLYVLDVNPWNGVNFYPTGNNGQAMITNFGTSQAQGLYNRMVSELRQADKATAIQNTIDYMNYGIWNANYYYVVVKLRKNADGSAVGKTSLGVHVYSEITSYEVVRGQNSYFW